MSLNAIFNRIDFAGVVARWAAEVHRTKPKLAWAEYEPIDISALPWTELEASSGSRSAETLDTIVMHVTDVRGGFGVDARPGKEVDQWEERIARGQAPVDVLVQLPATLTAREQCEAMALFSRWRNTPYHLIVGKRYTVWNRPLTQRSWHAGPAGNDGVGVAIDVHRHEVLSMQIVHRAQYAIGLLRRRIGGEKVTAHRCYSKAKAPDPGPEVWGRIVCPLLDAGTLVCDYDMVNGGLPIPHSWDPSGPYDEKGRRI